MLEKLATHEVHEVGELLTLADKCARTAEDRAWHNPLATQPGLAGQTPKLDGQGKKKKKKKKAPEQVVVFAAGEFQPGTQHRREQKTPKVTPDRGKVKMWCKLHNSDSHDLKDCQIVKNIAERNRLSTSDDDNDKEGDATQFQTAKRVIAVIHNNVGSAASRRTVKLLRRQVTAVAALPESRCPLKCASMPISFGPNDLPQNMAGAGELPLMVSPTIANACLKHVLVDGRAGLNVLSL
ncbi:hypothetical protein U9M48_036487 [Paspalum notatum var. saurae]|uniref:Uncharacterized protein n=1 Tax=Paspalum notatum var. saurae TaxID=547442 RepID=A0AAQ3X9K2_PASNO